MTARNDRDKRTETRRNKSFQETRKGEGQERDRKVGDTRGNNWQ